MPRFGPWVLPAIINKAVYMTASVACGWAGAVMWGAGAMGGAIYMKASVTCDWTGAVVRKPLQKLHKRTGVTDGPTDRWTNDF